MRSIAILYHQTAPGVDCPDGIISAWVAKRAYIDADVIGCCYQSPSPDLSNYHRAICVDFSFKRTQIEQWLADGIDIDVIDHHLSAFDELESLSHRILFQYDLAECGATLAWRHFFPDKPMPEFLKFVRDRDLFLFELPETPIVHEAMSALGRNNFVLLDRLAMMSRRELIKFLAPIGTERLRLKQEAIAAIVGRVEWGEIAGVPNIPFVRLQRSENRLASDVCTALYLQFPDALFSACLLEECVELRSNREGNNTDVRRIAEQFGGGGHRNAAGFKLTEIN